MTHVGRAHDGIFSRSVQKREKNREKTPLIEIFGMEIDD
jgi:hypothetical protein